MSNNNDGKELFNCLSKLSKFMKDGTYFFFDKNNNEIILNDKVLGITENNVYRITNFKPRDVFINSGFIHETSVSN